MFKSELEELSSDYWNTPSLVNCVVLAFRYVMCRSISRPFSFPSRATANKPTPLPCRGEGVGSGKGSHKGKTQMLVSRFPFEGYQS